MRTFQKLIVPLLLTSAYALDIRQLIQEAGAAVENNRELQDESSNALTCLSAALTFGTDITATDPTDPMQGGVLFGTLNLVLGSDLTTICPDPSACDLAGTTLSEQAAGLCTSAEGQLVTTDLAICKATLLTLLEATGATGPEVDAMLDGVTDISVSNIPICVPPAPICPADFDLFPAIASVLDTLVAFLPADQADSAETKAILDAVSKVLEGEECTEATSGSSALSSLFVAGILAMGASLFATL